MRAFVLSLLLAASGAHVSAQPVVQPPAPRAYDAAPWWMDKPIIASTGAVTAETPANRAAISVVYEAVDHDLVQATRMAIQKAKAVTGPLAAFGPQNVHVETAVAVRPLYEQYRDKQGNKVDNERADKIDSYQVTVQMSVEVRDVRLVEPVYAILVSAKPSSTQPVEFNLEPSDETRTQMFKLAVEDARRRAELAVSAAGTKLGTVRLIDPTGRACETDVLVAGARARGSEIQGVPVAAPPAPRAASTSVEELVVTSQKQAQAAGLRPEEVRMPIQTPLEKLEASACVVFSLG